jgi:hypothetical protein
MLWFAREFERNEWSPGNLTKPHFQKMESASCPVVSREIRARINHRFIRSVSKSYTALLLKLNLNPYKRIEIRSQAWRTTALKK